MCNPVFAGIAIGAAVGAVSSAVTGGDVLQGALIGGALGGFTPGSIGVSASQSAGKSIAFNLTDFAIGSAVSLAGSYAMNTLMPKAPDYTGYTPAAQQVAEQQQFNSQQIATTGSGGRQASASLAEAISRSKKRKLSQADVSDLSIDTSSFASTGLQFA